MPSAWAGRLDGYGSGGRKADEKTGCKAEWRLCVGGGRRCMMCGGTEARVRRVKDRKATGSEAGGAEGKEYM